MTISSRTSGGIPHRCPVCGHEEDMEISINAGDSCCPTCGQLMWMAEHNIVMERVHELNLRVARMLPAPLQNQPTLKPAATWFERLKAYLNSKLGSATLAAQAERKKRRAAKASVS